MTVAGLALDASNRSPIVLLRGPSGRRQVPILIDHAQAHSIVAGLENAQQNPPLSHDLMVSLLEAGQLYLDRIIIHEMDGQDFQAVLNLCSKKNSKNQRKENCYKPIEIPVRPSDAIALAIRTKSSVWMFEQVFLEASIPVDQEADAEDQNEFRHFLDDVNPSDLIGHLRDNNRSK